MPYKSKERRLEYQREHVKRHPEMYRYTEVKRQWEKARNVLRKKEVFLFYSGGTIQCAFCGVDDIDVLCIDHIYNNGRKHRRSIGNKGGNAFYRWLQKNNYPEGFQVLCANCNQKKQVLRYKEEK